MTKPKFSFVGIPTRILEKELERRASLAYHRRVNAELKAARERGPQPKKDHGK